MVSAALTSFATASFFVSLELAVLVSAFVSAFTPAALASLSKINMNNSSGVAKTVSLPFASFTEYTF